MKLSTKGRYAVTALADIALQGGVNPVPLADIAERQDISLAYLEQLFVRLRRAGIVSSIRGPGGGYRLASAPDGIRIADVMAAVDERLNALGDGAIDLAGGTEAGALTQALWEQLSAHVHVFLSRTTLADVVGDRMVPCPAVPDFTEMLEHDETEARA